MTALAAIQPLHVLIQLAFLLAGSLLLWFGGRFPQNLSELCPAYLKAVPEDLFAAGPLDYQRTENGYKLSCPLPHPRQEDDEIVIQVPVPVVEEEPPPPPTSRPRSKRRPRR
jgi:hypothetical protein